MDLWKVLSWEYLMVDRLAGQTDSMLDRRWVGQLGMMMGTMTAQYWVVPRDNKMVDLLDASMGELKGSLTVDQLAQ